MTDPDLYAGESVSATSREGSVSLLSVDASATAGEQFRRDLGRACAAVVDADPGAVVVTGDPGAFALSPATIGSAGSTVPSEATQCVLDEVAALDCAVVAALRGTVSGAGIAVGLAADLRVGSETSTYGMASLEAGCVPSERIRRQFAGVVGRDRAGEFLSTGGRYGAATVAEWGFLNATEPPDAAVERALDMAGTFAERSPVPYQYMKRAVAAVSPASRTGRLSRPPALHPEPPAATGDSLNASNDQPVEGTVAVDEPREGVARITLDRRRRLNALTGPMLAAFHDALDDVQTRGPRAVVVEGAGRRAFSIGLDVRAPVSRTADPTDGRRISRLGQEATETLASLPVPVVAAVSGRALGGGFEVALAADVRVGGESSTYGLPEVTHGLLPAAGGTQRLPATVGTGRATELLFTGTTFDADTMAEWGVLSDVVPDERVTEASIERADRLAREGVDDRGNRSFGTEDCPTADGLRLERLGLGHAFSLDPFDVEGDG